MMSKQAERPITVSFQDDSSCTFDSNDFVEFEILTQDLPMGEIVFRGMPYTTRLTELGRCVFDYCDHGLYVYQELANMLYEAQHPWLDYADAVEKGAFDNEKAQDVECLCGFIMKEGLNWSAPIGSFEISNIIKEAYEMKEDDFTVAFKPVKSLDFYYFNEVKVWQPPQ
jgi:hypothetical protein